MKVAEWLEKPVSEKKPAQGNIVGRDQFFRQVSSIFSHNENEFSRGASRDQRFVSPLMVELLP